MASQLSEMEGVSYLLGRMLVEGDELLQFTCEVTKRLEGGQ